MSLKEMLKGSAFCEHIPELTGRLENIAEITEWSQNDRGKAPLPPTPTSSPSMTVVMIH